MSCRFVVVIFIFWMMIYHVYSASDDNGEERERHRNTDPEEPPPRVLPFRNWPTKATSFGGWVQYFAYLLTTFLSPIFACFCFCCFMSCGTCCFLFVYAPYGYWKHIACIGCYMILFVLCFNVTFVTIGISIWGGVSTERMKRDGVKTALKIFDLPERMTESTVEMKEFPPLIVSEEVDPVIKLVDNVSPRLIELKHKMNTTGELFLSNLPNKIEDLYNRYETVKNEISHVQFFNITSNVNFSLYEFPTTETIIPLKSSGLYKTSIDDVNFGILTLNQTKIDVLESRGSFEEISNFTMRQLRNATLAATEVVGDVLEAIGLSSEFFETIRPAGTIVVISIVFILIMLYLLFLFQSCFGLCFLYCCWQGVLCLAFGSCFGSMTVTTIASFHIFLFFAVGDVCAQGEYYTIKNVEGMEILNWQIPVFANSTLHINALDLTRSILHCGADDQPDVATYFDCIGLEMSELNLTLQYLPAQEQMRMAYVTGFNYSYLEDSLEKALSFDDVEVPDNFTILSNHLLDLFSKVAGTDRDGLLIGMGYNKTNETELYRDLNSILDEVCDEKESWLPIENSNIIHFANNLDSKPYNVCVCHNRSQIDSMVPQLVHFHQILESTFITELDANISSIKQGFEAMQGVVDLINEDLDQVTHRHPPKILIESQMIKAWSGVFLTEINDIGDRIEENVDRRMDSMDGVECGPEGDFYADLLNHGCGDMDLAVGLVGFGSLGLALIYFCMFWTQCYISLMLRTKKMKESEDEDYFEDDEEDELEKGPMIVDSGEEGDDDSDFSEFDSEIEGLFKEDDDDDSIVENTEDGDDSIVSELQQSEIELRDIEINAHPNNDNGSNDVGIIPPPPVIQPNEEQNEQNNENNNDDDDINSNENVQENEEQEDEEEEVITERREDDEVTDSSHGSRSHSRSVSVGSVSFDSESDTEI